jgi:hypothetical protein
MAEDDRELDRRRGAQAGCCRSASPLDIDEDDNNIVVAGNFLVNGQAQSYVALLNAEGSRLWEKLGATGRRGRRRRRLEGQLQQPRVRRRLAPHERQPGPHGRHGVGLPVDRR